MNNLVKATFISLLLLILTGCGDKGDILDKREHKLIVWQTETDKKAIETLKEVEDEFEKVHPTVDLVVESVSWEALSEKLTKSIRDNSLPDVAHIQPFMAYSLVNKGLLLPITDLIDELEKEHGGIWPSVRNLQKYDGENYGIAYAVGSTFWSVKLDNEIDHPDLDKVKTLNQYLEMVIRAKNRGGNYKILLPGGSPFFIDQLYGELLANYKGRFFDPKTFEPEFTSKENINVLKFFRNLQETGALDPSWATTSYLEQFEKLAKGEAFSAPVTYARAAQTVEKHVELGSGNKNDVGPKSFRWLTQPTPDEHNSSVSTIDCEPFVIFNVAAKRTLNGKINNFELGKAFLKMFYSKEHYHKFTQSVPIQLTPIFKDMADSFAYKASIGKWRDWHEKATDQLASENNAKPIFMPDTTDEARKLPFLMEFQASRIVSNAVKRAINEPNVAIEKIAEDMQQDAIEFVNNYK